ncbi:MULTISPECIES: sodium:calcium antiporter [Pontibacillus]|uniref:Sodium:calcium antiporter n=1 Tax=Pontibacillus chungwhensis TaxID=265426 RepID=A0ABY8UUR9_9BACI|nr:MULTISPECIES: sodium:calcium antiporter [Pontibacillus]MCD5323107.1 sodium:calcium antiporter [Pontibacillus sp. HN14]WIF96496.1 sodium:calcium antiporter [Pontibacillus chungwhensis]
MTYILFTIAALVTFLLAVNLSTYADIIEKKSAATGAMIGLLLGAATSLPEITTSITAVTIDNPDLALGNLLGSNLFNVLILALFDLYYRRSRLLGYSTNEHAATAGLGLLMSMVILLSFVISLPYSFFGVGLDSLIIIVFYLVGIRIISQFTSNEANQPVEEANARHVQRIQTTSLQQAILYFALAAIGTILAGSLLTVTGDQIAKISGLGSTFVGSLLIAASTSLPEAVSSFIAIRLRNYSLMMNGILGSNLFNLLILAGTDLFFRNGPLLQAGNEAHVYSIIGSMLLIALTLYAILRKKPLNTFSYMFPSVLIVIIYLASSYLIYTHSTV